MRPDTHQCLLLKLAPVRTFQQHVWTLFRVREESSIQVHPSTSKRISFADTDMGRQLQSSGRQVYIVQMLSLIRQDVKKNCNHLDVRATLSGRQSLLLNLRVAEVQPSGRGLIQERFLGLFRKPVIQLSIRTASAYVRTPPRENRIRVDLSLL
jgi:hypothetical protein